MFPYTELQEVFIIWQDAFEWSYYDEILAGIMQLNHAKETAIRHQDSIKRIKVFRPCFVLMNGNVVCGHMWKQLIRIAKPSAAPVSLEWNFIFRPNMQNFTISFVRHRLHQSYLIKEYDVSEKRKHDLFYTDKTHQFITGFFSALIFGFWAGFRLVKNVFKPQHESGHFKCFCAYE